MKKHWSIVIDSSVNPATPIVLDDGLIRVYCKAHMLVSDQEVQDLVTHLNLAIEIKAQFNS